MYAFGPSFPSKLGNSVHSTLSIELDGIYDYFKQKKEDATAKVQASVLPSVPLEDHPTFTPITPT
jgi:hypothetical protein